MTQKLILNRFVLFPYECRFVQFPNQFEKENPYILKEN